MVAFRDELINFRDVRRKVSSLDQLFKKCPTCGRERRIPDMADYPFKLRAGSSVVFFCRESCMRKYIAAHPECEKHEPRSKRQTWSEARYKEVALRRARKAKEYIKLQHEGMTTVAIGKMFKITTSAVNKAIERYFEDIALGKIKEEEV